MRGLPINCGACTACTMSRLQPAVALNLHQCRYQACILQPASGCECVLWLHVVACIVSFGGFSKLP